MRGSRCISRVWNDLQDEDTDGESGMNLSGINGYLAGLAECVKIPDFSVTTDNAETGKKRKTRR